MFLYNGEIHGFELPKESIVMPFRRVLLTIGTEKIARLSFACEEITPVDSIRGHKKRKTVIECYSKKVRYLAQLLTS